MADRDASRRPRPPRFPRRRWTPGQVERAEEPERGGAYDRARQRREAEQEIEESRPDDGTDAEP